MAARPVLALFGWGFTVEDFLQPNGLTLADFCGDFTGSWMFGYADALRTAGVDTVLFCTSSDVSVLTRVEHGATRTAISLLPPPACIDSFARRGCSTVRSADGHRVLDCRLEAGRDARLVRCQGARPLIATHCVFPSGVETPQLRRDPVMLLCLSSRDRRSEFE